MHSRRELADGFRALGVAPGDTVMLHASVRSVGPVAGGPDQIHLALKDALSSEGTLIMYASCPAYVDEVGRGHLTEDQERELLEKLTGSGDSEPTGKFSAVRWTSISFRTRSSA